MKNKINQLFAAILIMIAAFTASPLKAQVTIGELTKPDDNAVLDLRSKNKLGLLLPRLQLQATNLAAPMSGHVAGMVVYNTDPSGGGATAVTPGYYYNDGTKWVRIANQADLTTYTGSTSIFLNAPNNNSFERAALTGDVTATANSNTVTVTGLQGRALPATATVPSDGQILKYSTAAPAGWRYAADNNDNTFPTLSTNNTSVLTFLNNATATPSINFVNAPANTIFGNNTGAAALPNYFLATALPIAGDVTGTLGTATVARLQGRNVASTAPTTNQFLAWNGSAWTPTGFTSSTSITANTANNSFERAALTGDVTATANSNTVTVTGLQGKPVSATAPTTNGQVLAWNGSNWAPAAAPASGTWNQITTATTATTNTQNIYQAGKVAIGPTYGSPSLSAINANSTLEVNGAVTNTSATNAGTGTAINFALSNLAYSTATGNPQFNCTGLKDGGTYTLAWQGTAAGTATITTNMTTKMVINPTKNSNQDAVYTIVCIGTVAYVYATLF